MKSNSSFTWEIVIVGILLTAVAIYFNNKSDHSSFSAKNIEKVLDNHDIHFNSKEKPHDVVIINPGQIFNAKILDSLKSAPNIDSLRIRIKNLKNEILRQASNDTAMQKQVMASVNSALQNLSDVNQSQFKIDTGKNSIIIIPKTNMAVASSMPNILNKQFNASGVKGINLKSPGGSIEVKGMDGNTVDVNVKPGKSGVSSKEFKKYYDVKIYRNGSTINVAIEKKDGFNLKNLFESMSANITVRVPFNMNVEGETAGGSLDIREIHGNVNMKTLGGHIYLKALKGNLELKTMGGSMTGSELNGKISMKTMGGSITLDNSKGDVNVTSSGGNINLDQIAGSVTAHTLAGNVTASMVNLSGDLLLKTNAGNVSITLPKTAGAKLDLDGSNVSLHDDLKVSGNVGKGHVSGNLNGGGNYSINAHTYAGNINLYSH